MSLIRFKDGSVKRCDVIRDDCEKPATHHTEWGGHYCNEHWEEVKQRSRQRRRVKLNQALANIERIGKGG